MKRQKKWLALYLVLVMMATMIPSASFALTPADAGNAEVVEDEKPSSLTSKENAKSKLAAGNPIEVSDINELTAAIQVPDAVILIKKDIKLEKTLLVEHNLTFVGENDSIKLTVRDADSSLDPIFIRHMNINGADKVVFENVILAGNPLSIGGGIEVAPSDKPVQIDGVHIQNCVANDSGGGIYTASDLVLTDAMIKDCSARVNGGGIYTTKGMDLQLINSQILDGESGKAGGGIFGEEGKITLDGSKIERCYVSKEVSNPESSGGGICTLSGEVKLMNQSEIIGCIAAMGGGIVSLGGDVTLENSTIKDCLAEQEGGGISAYGGSITLSDSEIERCKAILTIYGQKEGKEVIVFQDPGFGGGIQAENSVLQLTGSKISDCSAGSGGGMYLGNDAIVKLSGSTIVGCEAIGPDSSFQPVLPGGYGGGICAIESATVELTKESVIARCKAPFGGGILLRTSNVTLDNSTIEDCTAQQEGGGISVYGGSVTLLAKSKIKDCKALFVFPGVQPEGPFEGQLEDPGFGGGIQIEQGNLTMKDSELSGCFAGNGGGAYLGESAFAELTNSRITECKAAEDGGGIYTAILKNVTTSGVEFVKNTAAAGYGTLEKDKPLHEQKITSSSEYERTYTLPFGYAYNNYDISYKGEEVTLLKVTFDANNGGWNKNEDGSYGKTAVDSLMFKDQLIAEKQIPAEPTREGYGFNGWYKDPEGTVVWNFEKDLVEEDIILYAKWEEKSLPSADQYEVTFDSQGGSDVSSLTGVEKDSKINKPADPTRSGYRFDGWYKESTSEHIWDFDKDAVTSNITLYAKWTYISGGGNNNNNKGKDKNIPDDKTPLGLLKDDHIAYVQGYPEGDFRQERPITRAEAAQLFYNLLIGVNKTGYASAFPDVKSGAWYADAVNCLSANKVISGYPDGNFKPDAYISRAEFATLASKFDELSSSDTNRFNDVSNNHWAVSYINSASVKGWIKGYEGGEFRPERNITRAEVVTLVNAILERKVSLDNILKDARQFTDLTSTHWAYCDIMEATNGHTYERKSDGLHELWGQIQH